MLEFVLIEYKIRDSIDRIRSSGILGAYRKDDLIRIAGDIRKVRKNTNFDVDIDILNYQRSWANSTRTQ